MGDLPRAYPGTSSNGVSPFTNLNDFIVINVDTSVSPQSVIIPSAQIAVDYNFFVIKDDSNNAATNNITVTMEGGETIDGTITEQIINADSGGLEVYSLNGNLFTW